jgi:AcrR family transcriptional regulator
VGAITTKATTAQAAPADRRGRLGVKGERTRQRIKAAFAELLEGKTFASVTIADICRTADITVGGFYFHFASQEELLDEAMAEYVTALIRDLDGALETAGEALAEAVCGAFLSAYSERVGLARTFQQLTRMRADYAVRWQSASGPAMQRLAEWLAGDRADLAPDQATFLAYALVTMIMSKLDLVYVYRDPSIAATAPSRPALSSELPALWRRMTQPGSTP